MIRVDSNLSRWIDEKDKSKITGERVYWKEILNITKTKFTEEITPLIYEASTIKKLDLL